MKQKKQMSDSIRLGILLALSGGFMDAYSYLCRNHVFANAQTGNILLFGVNLSQQNYKAALQYLCPILSFTIGIILSDLIRHSWKEISLLHWRQISVLIEAVILLWVGFIPAGYNLLANSLTSLSCGIQVESFRKIHGNGIATTMCIGNLRSGTENLCNYFFEKKKEDLKKGLLYYGIILCFISGAVVGSTAIGYLHEKAIMICSVILFITFLLMFINNRKYKIWGSSY